MSDRGTALPMISPFNTSLISSLEREQWGLLIDLADNQARVQGVSATTDVRPIAHACHEGDIAFRAVEPCLNLQKACVAGYLNLTADLG